MDGGAAANSRLLLGKGCKPLPRRNDEHLLAIVGNQPNATLPVCQLDGRDLERRLKFQQGRRRLSL